MFNINIFKLRNFGISLRTICKELLINTLILYDYFLIITFVIKYNSRYIYIIYSLDLLTIINYINSKLEALFSNPGYPLIKTFKKL